MVGHCIFVTTATILSTKYIFESLLILSGAYLLVNAASYNGEILHAEACRPCAGHVLGFMSIGVVVTKIMTFCLKLRACRPRLLQRCTQMVLRLWVGRWDRGQ